ncbi:C4-dicarboxylate transporter DcuC [Escherichia coli]|uniref:C4-dicarboxylate transporter DcuC n=1 Tax=Escherichia coli TaxID=562 RepID=A0A376UDR0_ECOLX|nr:C4-dicarboxylate transporter DcuC [Escherichia coli]
MAFVEMIPKLAHSSGINPAYLTIPMLQASNPGPYLSPVSGVVVAGCRDGEDLAV